MVLYLPNIKIKTMDEGKLEIRECDYGNEHYKVRYDGVVWRCKKDGRKNSRFDEFWTKGDWGDLRGYQICDVQTCRIIAKAYLGIDDNLAEIQFKDGDRRNLSVDNICKRERNTGHRLWFNRRGIWLWFETFRSFVLRRKNTKKANRTSRFRVSYKRT